KAWPVRSAQCRPPSPPPPASPPASKAAPRRADRRPSPSAGSPARPRNTTEKPSSPSPPRQPRPLPSSTHPPPESEDHDRFSSSSICHANFQSIALRDALLHHLARLARQRPGTDDPQSLDGRKRPPLGARHDLPRRRMPRANRQRPLQPRHRQAQRPQRAENPQKQGFAAHAPQSRRMGRKRPRRLHRRIKRSVDSPEAVRGLVRRGPPFEAERKKRAASQRPS